MDMWHYWGRLVEGFSGEIHHMKGLDIEGYGKAIPLQALRVPGG
jgi:hypothetical protein